MSCTNGNSFQNSQADSYVTSETTKVTEVSSTLISDTNSNSTTPSESKDVPETSVSETKPEIPELSYNFDGLVSQKYVEALTNKNYIMTYSIPDMKITQRICLDGSNVFSTFTNDGMSYDMLYRNNTQYMIYKQNYCKVDISGTAENLVKIFSEIGYVGSGETEYNGEKCKYDEFYQTAFDTNIKLIINEAGEFVAFDQVGTLARIDEFNTQADESLFAIPDDYKEVDEDTIQQLFAEEYTSLMGRKSN